MASAPKARSSNAFVRGYTRVSSAFGFERPYNLPLYIIFAGALMGFTLSRFMNLNVDGMLRTYSTVVGEWFEETKEPTHTVITIHLASILPAAFLVCLQLTPVIRHECIMYYRIAGHVVLLLLLVSNVSAIVLAPAAYGGHLATRCGIGFLVILTTVGATLAYINIKRKQFD